MKRNATFENTELRSGDRISIETRYGTKGAGVILGFRPVRETINICVKMDEDTKFADNDRFPFRDSIYDRIADIGITFDEIKDIDRKPVSKRGRKPKVAVEAEPEPEVVVEKLKKPRAKKAKTNGSSSEPTELKSTPKKKKTKKKVEVEAKEYVTDATEVDSVESAPEVGHSALA
jgi:hypothetical protein